MTSQFSLRCSSAARPVTASLVILVCGCSPAAPFPMGAVHGSVSYQGQPLEHGRVFFLPEATTAGPGAVGEIQADGSFKMQTAGREGAALGPHLVTVHCRGQIDQESAQLSLRPEIPPSLIPERYSHPATSPLRFEVKEGRNEYPIVLE